MSNLLHDNERFQHLQRAYNGFYESLSREITKTPKEPIYLEDDLMTVQESLRKLIETAAYWLGESDHTYPIPFRFIRRRELLYKLENIADEKAMERGNAIQKAVIKRVQQMEQKALDDFLGMIAREQSEIIGQIWEEERLKEEGKMHKEPHEQITSITDVGIKIEEKIKKEHLADGRYEVKNGIIYPLPPHGEKQKTLLEIVRCKYCGALPQINMGVEWLVMCEKCLKQGAGNHEIMYTGHSPEEAIKNWNEGNKEPRVFEGWVGVFRRFPDIIHFSPPIFDNPKDAENVCKDADTGSEWIAARKIRYTEGGKIEDVTDE